MNYNSIRTNLSREDIISDIKLTKSADINKEHVYIIVEGQDDIKAMSKFFCDTVFLYESYSGKEGVEDIVTFFNIEEVIGIRDKDYQLAKKSQYIFYYDYCCLEMMMIFSDYVFQNLCTEFYRGKFLFSDLRLKILKELKEVSILRKYNEQNSWGINFHVIKPSKFWRPKTMDIDYSQLYNSLSLIPKKGFDKNLIDADMKITWNYNDYLSNTQGHDYFSIFASVCSVKKGVNQENISAAARVCYNMTEFKKTVLFQDLNNHSININRCITN